MYIKITDKESLAWKTVGPAIENLILLREKYFEYTRRNRGTEFVFSILYAIGPVEGIKADNPPPGWRIDKAEGPGWWTQDLRTKAGKALWNEAQSIGHVYLRIFCDDLNYEYDQDLGFAQNGKKIRSIPGVNKCGDTIVIGIHKDAKYNLIPGMQEIELSEFLAIQNIDQPSK